MNSAPAVQAGRYFSLCRSSATPTGAPKLQASANSEVNVDIQDGFKGFVRGLVRYQGTREDANSGIRTQAQTTIDAFAGFKTPVGGEVSLFAQNLTNQQIDTFAQRMFGLFGDSTGYSAGARTLGREVGILVRFDY